MPTRPPFIVSAADVPEKCHRYPDSEEEMAPARAIGRAAGLRAIGVHLNRVPPGRRTSYPHAESAEEEFVYVVEGEIDAWVDGELHPMQAGDFAAFPSGTGICHTFINNGDRDALLLSGGEADKAEDRLYYPHNPERRSQMPATRWWHDVPRRPQGAHDGKPDPIAPAPAGGPPVRLEGGSPVFRVRDLAASVAWYAGVLGFTRRWGDAGFACVARDRFSLFLCEGDQGETGAWAWIGVSDVHRLHQEVRAAGARIRHPPTSYPWACEMQVEDPDGNVLRMGSDPDPGAPVGDWLDMRGDPWRRSPDGTWVRAPRP